MRAAVISQPAPFYFNVNLSNSSEAGGVGVLCVVGRRRWVVPAVYCGPKPGTVVQYACSFYLYMIHVGHRYAVPVYYGTSAYP
jgi:hypothetical protein